MKQLLLIASFLMILCSCDKDLIENSKDPCPDPSFNNIPLCNSTVCDVSHEFVWCNQLKSHKSDYHIASDEYLIVISIFDSRIWFYRKDNGMFVGEVEISENRELIYQVEVIDNILLVGYKRIAIDAYDLTDLSVLWSVESSCEEELLNAKMTIDQGNIYLSSRNRCSNESSDSKYISIDIKTGEVKDLITFTNEEMPEAHYCMGIRKWTNQFGEIIFILLVHDDNHARSNEVWAYNFGNSTIDWKLEDLKIFQIHEYAPIIYQNKMLFLGRDINTIDLSTGSLETLAGWFGVFYNIEQINNDVFVRSDVKGFLRVDILTGSTYWSAEDIYTPHKVSIIDSNIYCSWSGGYAVLDNSDGSRLKYNEMFKWKIGVDYIIEDVGGQPVYYVFYENQFARLE